MRLLTIRHEHAGLFGSVDFVMANPPLSVYDQVLLLFTQIEKLGEYNEKLVQARDLLLPKLMNGELKA